MHGSVGGYTYIALLAVVACPYEQVAVITSVHEAITDLLVELIEHGHGGVLGPAEGGEFPVPLLCHGEEGFPTIHEVTADDVVRVCSFRKRRGGASLWRLEEDYKE